MTAHVSLPTRTLEPLPQMPVQPVLGVPLALTDYEPTLDWIDAAVAPAPAATSASPPCTR